MSHLLNIVETNFHGSFTTEHINTDCYSGFAPQELTEEKNIIGEPVLEVEFKNVSRKDGMYVQFEV